MLSEPWTLSQVAAPSVTVELRAELATVRSRGSPGLHLECGRIFRAGKSAVSAGVSLTLIKHQKVAIGFAQSGESYVLTTGTGSGKSSALFRRPAGSVAEALHRAQPANVPQCVLVEHLGVTQEVEVLQNLHALAQLLQTATERAHGSGRNGSRESVA